MLTLGPECVPPGRQEGKPDRKGKLFVCRVDSDGSGEPASASILVTPFTGKQFPSQ
jgi:hypothetical protein